MRTEQLNIVREDCAGALDSLSSRLAPLRDAHILVTGGTGFIGSWIAEAVSYLNEAHGFNAKLTLVARRMDRAEEMSRFASNPAITLKEADVRDLYEIPDSVTWVIHAGASPDNRTHTSEPVKTADIIVGGTKTLLQAATRLPNLNGFLYLSSGLVNGGQPLNIDTVKENQFFGFDSTTFGSLYAESKRMAEALCTAYANQHRIRVVIARPFAFIGPFQLLDRPWAINNFIRDSLLGGPIRILGDGEAVRSYMYPADMAAWLLVMLVEGQAGTSYNVGNSHGIRLRDLAEMIAGECSPRPVISQPSEASLKHARTRFVPDTSRARIELGLIERTDIRTAIHRTILWNRQLSAIRD